MRGGPVCMIGLAVIVGLPASVPLASGEDVEQPVIELFDPLIAKNPTPERELEVTVESEKGGDGREVETDVELAWRLGERLEARIEIPAVLLLPREGSNQAGLGDITLGGKVLVFQSIEQPVLATLGLDVGLPTGSRRRGLGGALTMTPYVTVGMGLGPADVIGDVLYTWVVEGTGEQAQSLQVDLAAAYRKWRRTIPLLELSIVTQTRRARGAGDAGQAEESAVGTPQVYLTPGVIIRSLPWLPPGSSLRGGVQLALTDAREFDYRLIASFSWEF